ncbi:hypothetical protein SAMN05877753_104295 [Bacillus oleivorans]|uniref:Uncharacterized protein n=1 Tax=Bacillus oleivorans TaxID=1448271 RepID=A0A285CT35_9BACI|nr:hypothetical protein SAMN05877753_104295 [Bacillus oleivorans]
MVEFIKHLFEKVSEMIEALVEFDYEEAYEEMLKKK